MTDGFDGDAAVRALEERGVLGRACPMCGKKEQWDVGKDGYFELATLSEDETETSTGLRPSLGAVAVQCGACGFVALHARSVLGLAGLESTDDASST
jgi:hypothetical protein